MLKNFNSWLTEQTDPMSMDPAVAAPAVPVAPGKPAQIRAI